MRISLTRLALIAGFSSPMPGFADPAAELELTLARNAANSVNFKRMEAAFALPLGGSAYGLQVDLAMAKYEGLTSTAPSGGVHLTYALGDAVKLGGYFIGEDRRGANFTHGGLELLWQTGGVSADGYVGWQDTLNAGPGAATDGMRAGLDVTYAPDDKAQLRLLAGAHGTFLNGGGDQSQFYLGAGWQFAGGLSLDATVAHTDQGEMIGGLIGTYRFGEDTLFNRRDFLGAFRGN